MWLRSVLFRVRHRGGQRSRHAARLHLGILNARRVRVLPLWPAAFLLAQSASLAVLRLNSVSIAPSESLCNDAKIVMFGSAYFCKISIM